MRIGGSGATGPLATTPHAGFDLALRGDWVFTVGGSEDYPWKVGPAVEFRTLSFASAALGAGVTVLAPVNELFPIAVTVAAGYDWRASYSVNGPYLLTSVFAGFRMAGRQAELRGLSPFAGLYFAVRTSLIEPHFVEIGGGVELDPVGLSLLFRNWMHTR